MTERQAHIVHIAVLWVEREASSSSLEALRQEKVEEAVDLARAIIHEAMKG